jgi:transcription initiation factor TFIIIB Brf1 subunit/transcription initiation factor TFIIB
VCVSLQIYGLPVLTSVTLFTSPNNLIIRVSKNLAFNDVPHINKVIQPKLFASEIPRTAQESEPLQTNPKMQQLEYMCSDCMRETKLVEIGSDLTCTACGLVVQAGRLTFDAEWRSFDDDMGIREDNSRVGFPGQEDDAKRREEEALFSFSEVHQLPEVVVEGAKQIATLFKTTQQITTIPYKGADRKKTFAAACIYYATKQTQGLGRSKDEIASTLNVCSKTLNRICSDIEEVIGFDQRMRNGVRVTDMVNRYVSLVRASDNNMLRKSTLKLYDMVKDSEHVMTMSPTALIGTLIYMACQYHKQGITLKSISTICNVSNTTILQYYAKFAKHIEKINK